jgi:hypothetical protein
MRKRTAALVEDTARVARLRDTPREGWIRQYNLGGVVAAELVAGADGLEVLAFGVHSPGDDEMVTDRPAR